MTLLAGVDVGASHIDVALADTSNGARGRTSTIRARADRSNPAGLGEETVAAIRACVKQYADQEAVGAIVVGSAGVGREDIRARADEALRRGFESTRALLLTTDGAIALESAFRGAPGVVVSAGTGSIGYARDASGAVWRVGGLGWQFGDEGSGYALGRAGLGAVGRASDARGPDTALTQSLGHSMGVDTITDMVRWTQLADRVDVAGLARSVCDTARAGDPVARQLVEACASDLAQHVRALMERFPASEAVDVAMSGGLVSEGSPVRDELVTLLRQESRIRLRTAPVDPAMGAIALASQLDTR